MISTDPTTGPSSPAPETIRSARVAAGMTQAKAAAQVYASARTWQNWERPIDSLEHRAMPAIVWEAWLDRVQLDPELMRLSALPD